MLYGMAIVWDHDKEKMVTMGPDPFPDHLCVFAVHDSVRWKYLLEARKRSKDCPEKFDLKQTLVLRVEESGFMYIEDQMDIDLSYPDSKAGLKILELPVAEAMLS